VYNKAGSYPNQTHQLSHLKPASLFHLPGINQSLSQEQEHYLKQVKKCVTFIFVKKDDAFSPVGTGFFVGIEVHGLDVDVNEIPNHYFAVYLVTAKHVLQYEEGNYYSEIFIRLNRKGQRSAFIPINLRK
jgi:hypothetical protein